MNFPTKLIKFFYEKKTNFLLWIPVLFGFGVVFYVSFTDGFLQKFSSLAALFFISFALFALNRKSSRSFVFAACCIFLSGSFYAHFYQQSFFNHTLITGKIFVDVRGKVSDVRNFSNAINDAKGLVIVVSEPVLYKARFDGAKKEKPKTTSKKPSKKFLKLIAKCSDEDCRLRIKKEFEAASLEKKKQRDLKRVERLLRSKSFEKNFINLEGYQDIDRKFLDFSANYQKVDWKDIGNDRSVFPNPPSQISLISYSKFRDLKIGDEIFLRATLFPPKTNLPQNAASIGGYGYGSGEIVVLKKSTNSSFAEFIGNLRKKIEGRILRSSFSEPGFGLAEFKNSNPEFVASERPSRAIASALMVGSSQNLIAREVMTDVRNSGLAHLLSISGLHLALAAAIFFISVRFLLSRSEYLILHFEIKKIAAIIAIIAAYFYLELAGMPIPAVRSFIMVLVVFLAVIIDQKSDPKRCVALAAFLITLFDPYNIFTISFQLSFAAILGLVCFHQFFSRFRAQRNFDFVPKKALWYFLEIALASMVAQVATMPFLIYHFGNVAPYSLFANLAAIPIASFITMPLGFLSIFLMPLGLEKLVLQPMFTSIEWIIDIAHSVSSLHYSRISIPSMPGLGLVLAAIGGLIICLMEGGAKWLGWPIFLMSMVLPFSVPKPDLIFDGEQKFFAIYEKEGGLIFSKNLRVSRKRDLWMSRMNESQFKYFEQLSSEWKVKNGIDCDEKLCRITRNNKKILVILARSRDTEICKNDADVIVNLTAKYQLPACFDSGKIKIDNFDFYKNGERFLYLREGNILIRGGKRESW